MKLDRLTPLLATLIITLALLGIVKTSLDKLDHTRQQIQERTATP